MIGEPAAPCATLPPRSPGILAGSSGRAWSRRDDERWLRCALLPRGSRGATESIDEDQRFWIESLNRLADHLADINEEDDTDDDDATDTG
jgi:hypothetical protein